MDKAVVTEEYELIAKRCPSCESLVLAKVENNPTGEKGYLKDYKCSNCEWTSPANGTV